MDVSRRTCDISTSRNACERATMRAAPFGNVLGFNCGKKTRRRRCETARARSGGPGAAENGPERLGSQGTFDMCVEEQDVAFAYRIQKFPGNVSLEIESTEGGTVMEVFFDETEVEGPVDEGCGITLDVAKELVHGAMTLGWGSDSGVGTLPRLQMSASQILAAPIARDSSWQLPI